MGIISTANLRYARHSALASAVSIALLTAGTALAQETASVSQTATQSEAESESTTLDRIIVTARKRNESILEVPMSITAISAAELNERNLNTVQDVYRTIAGGANATGELILRGLSGGNSPTPGTTNQFVDGVPFESGSIFDIERIEVLRGPQGTLWGSNAIGGTVQVVTRKPQLDSFEVFGTLVGSKQSDTDSNGWRVEGGVNLPLVQDVLALRVAASVRHTPLPIFNAATGNYSSRDNQLVRTQLQWQPSTDMRFNLGHIYTKDTIEGTSRADRSRPGGFYVPSFTENPASDWGYDVDYAFNECPEDWERPSCFTGGRVADSRYTIYERLDGWARDTTNLVSLSFDHDDLLGFASMHYVGSYRENQSTSLDDWSRLDMADMMGTWIIGDDGDHRVTHELRFQNKESLGGLDWTLGFFQDRSWSGYNPNVQWQYHDADPQGIALFSDWNDWAWGDWADLGIYNVAQLGQALYGNPGINYNLTSYYSLIKERAAFGEASYRFDTGIGAFELTGGLRYYKLEDASHSFNSGIWFGPEGSDNIAGGEESGNRKKVSLAYKPNTNMNIYALYSEGYRPGGNNFPVLPNACAGDEFAPQFTSRYTSDKIDNYELGFKANLMDRRLRIASAVYQIDWSDVRASIYMPTCGFSYTANAAKARSRGVEFESSAYFDTGTVLTFNAAYTDSVMLSDVPALGASSGDDMTMVPKYNGYLALDQEFALFGKQAFARIDVAAYGAYKSHFNVRDEDRSKAYQTVNLSGRLHTSDSTVVSLHVSNLLDEEFTTYKAARSRTSTSAALHEIYGPGRTISLRFDYSFR